MARFGEDGRNMLWKKEDNGTDFDMWVTHREYYNAHAAKHGVIALQRHGWVMRLLPTARCFKVVAMRKVTVGPVCIYYRRNLRSTFTGCK